MYAHNSYILIIQIKDSFMHKTSELKMTICYSHVIKKLKKITQ